MPKRVTIYEVGARDGLQNEPTILTPAERTVFVDLLSRTGVSKVEAASFVHPKLVPQMADGAEIMAGIQQVDGVAYPVLVPNLRGFSDAVAAGARTVAVMTAASETFSQQNTQSSMKQQLERATAVVAAATQRGIPARGYISCALGCPFEGSVAPSAVAPLARALHEAGCYEVVISDTIGTGTAGSMADVLRAVLVDVPVESVAVHCHDTYGQALANILVALQHGVATVDSSVAGLGGCPFAGPGAAGNVATEDVLYMLNGLGCETGVDLDRVIEAGEYIVQRLGRQNASKAALASLRRRGAAFTPPSMTLGASMPNSDPQTASAKWRAPAGGRPWCPGSAEPPPVA